MGLSAMPWSIFKIFFPMEGGLGWVIFNFDIIKSKYVGCDCVGCLGFICERSVFVDLVMVVY